MISRTFISLFICFIHANWVCSQGAIHARTVSANALDWLHPCTVCDAFKNMSELCVYDYGARLKCIVRKVWVCIRLNRIVCGLGITRLIGWLCYCDDKCENYTSEKSNVANQNPVICVPKF